jgi:hypothetical protein
MSSRRAVAAIELALVTAGVLIPLMFGVWEIGRMIQVRQILSNSAREGARLAAQGYTIGSTGAVVQIKVATGTPNVTDTVYSYLVSMGLTKLQKSDVTVEFAFTAPGYVNGTLPAEPYLGDKGQPFYVKVTIPWAKVRWVNAGLINPTNLTFTVSWEMLRDDAFTLDTNLPAW